MLKYGKNCKVSLDALCVMCKVNDNENHRLNECTTHKNNIDSPFAHVNFDDIHSCDKNEPNKDKENRQVSPSLMVRWR